MLVSLIEHFPLCWSMYPLMFMRARGFRMMAALLTLHAKCIIG
jgi:hypothetical protein